MNPIAVLRRYFANVERSRQMLEEIREGVANLTDVTNRHLARLVDVMEAAGQEANSTGPQLRSAPPEESRSMAIDAAKVRTPFPTVTTTSELMDR